MNLLKIISHISYSVINFLFNYIKPQNIPYYDIFISTEIKWKHFFGKRVSKLIRVYYIKAFIHSRANYCLQGKILLYLVNGV